ncbi:PduM family microcompartment protein [Vibrio hannami]|uniref:PduM family microcompartment protein n=1 Tax=Vibrio hannami TaxID=2717094 RepID=UPI0024103EFB|nr:PduM family microcompartment protein [Vibrio hannami]MDG3085139.1 PduM family microcompartment protein [Vibrio hannami]
MSYSPDQSKNAPDISMIVEAVIKMLEKREGAVYKTNVTTLGEGLSPSIFTGYSVLSITLADLSFLCKLASSDDSNPAVKTVMDAVSYGMTLQISIHENLLARIPITSLSGLPIAYFDQLGQEINVTTSKVIDYSLAVVLKGRWLVAPSRSLITALATEMLNQRQIKLIKAE